MGPFLLLMAPNIVLAYLLWVCRESMYMSIRIYLWVYCTLSG